MRGTRRSSLVGVNAPVGLSLGVRDNPRLRRRRSVYFWPTSRCEHLVEHGVIAIAIGQLDPGVMDAAKIQPDRILEDAPVHQK